MKQCTHMLMRGFRERRCENRALKGQDKCHLHAPGAKEKRLQKQAEREAIRAAKSPWRVLERVQRKVTSPCDNCGGVNFVVRDHVLSCEHCGSVIVSGKSHAIEKS